MKIYLINDGVRRPVDALITARIRDGLDSEFTLSFTLTKADVRFVNDNTLVQYGEQYFHVISYQMERDGQSPICAVECEHISYCLNDDAYALENFVFKGSAANALTAVLSGTPLTAGAVEPGGTVNIALSGGTRKAVLISVAAILGGEIEYSGYTVNIRKHRGRTEPIELLGTDNVIGVSYNRSVLEGTTSYNIQLGRKTILSCGDNVHIKFAPLRLDVLSRITAIEYNPYNPYEVEIEVGDYVPDILDDYIGRSEKISSAVKAADRAQSAASKAQASADSVKDSLSDYVKTSDLSASIDTYVDSASGRASIVASLSGTFAKEDALNGFVEKTTLSAEIGAYIDTQAGTAKIVNRLEGTFLKEKALEGYVEKTSLTAEIGAYIDTQAGTAKIINRLEGTFLKEDALNGFVEKTELSAEIGAYIDTQAGTAKVVSAAAGTYQRKDDMSGYVTSSALNTSIGQYIDSTTGKAKVVSAVSGTYATKSELSGYVTTTNLNTSIGQYIDSTTGKAKVVSAVSGTYATKSELSGYATTTALSKIEQSVSDVQADITLSTSYSKNTIGTNVQALLQLVSNANSSTIKIKADKIDFTGFTTFLKASDLSSSGSTSIDGGRIKTGTISADRIDTNSIKLSYIYGKSGYVDKVALTTSTTFVYIGGDVGETPDYETIGIKASKKISMGAYYSTSNIVFDVSSKTFAPGGASSGITLGTSSSQWDKVYTKALYIDGKAIDFSSSATDRIYGSTSSTTNYVSLSTKTFAPNSSGFSIGSTSYPFETLYIGSSTYYWKMQKESIVPSSKSTTYFDIGSSTYPIYRLYAQEIYLNGTKMSTTGRTDYSGMDMKLGGSASYYIVVNTSREFYPSNSSTTSNAFYLGKSSYYWHYAYIGSIEARIGSNTGSKLGFFGTAGVTRQTVSSTATVATLITALKAYGLIG